MENELGKFTFTITAVRKSDGNIWFETDWNNQGFVPRDSIIMKLRALTHWMEGKYFSGFDSRATETERRNLE